MSCDGAERGPRAWKFGRFAVKKGRRSALSPSHTSGHKPICVPFGKDLGMSCAESQSSSHSLHIYTNPSYTHTPIFARSCVRLLACLRLIFIFITESAMGFLEAFTWTRMQAWPSPRRKTLELKCFFFFFVQRQHKARPACNKRVATHSRLTSQEGLEWEVCKRNQSESAFTTLGFWSLCIISGHGHINASFLHLFCPLLPCPLFYFLYFWD